MTLTLIVSKPRLPKGHDAQRDSLRTNLINNLKAPTVQLPVFDLKEVPAALGQLRDQLSLNAAERIRIIVFVSPSALEFGLKAIGPWPGNAFCGVMGRQSAHLAALLGVPKDRIIAPSMEGNEESEDSQGLFNLLTARFAAANCNITVCKGPRGRQEFAVQLRDRGFDVEELEIYDRIEIDQDADMCRHVVDLGRNAVLWITSSETITSLDRQMARHVMNKLADFRQECTVLVTHPRIRAKCLELGYTNVQDVATGIQSVLDWFEQHQHKTTNTKSDMTNQSNPAAESTTSVTAGKVDQAAPVNPTSGLVKVSFALSVISIALLIALVIAGKNQIEQTRVAFGERIQRDTTLLNVLKDQVKDSSDIYKDLKTRFDMMEENQKEAAAQRDALQEIYNKLLINRAEVSLSEIQQLVSIAKRQLFLLGNVKGAILALSQASDLLSSSEKPSLIRLKTAIDKDLADVKALPNVDVLPLAVSLDSVINSVDTLPMLSGPDATTDMTLDQYTDKATPKESPKEAANPSVAKSQGSGFNQDLQLVWQKVKDGAALAWHDIKGLIQITRVKTPEAFLISTQQANDVRNVLRLSLLNARISLLSRHSDLLQADLDRSDKMLDTYFDTKAVQVQRAKALIADLRDAQLNLTVPELQGTSAALALAVAAEGDKK